MQEIAEEANIPLRTLFDYCAGKTPIPRKRLETLASLLAYPVEQIVPASNSLSITPLKNAENTQGIAPALSEMPQVDKPRRELLQQASESIRATFITPSQILTNGELFERLSNDLTNS